MTSALDQFAIHCAEIMETIHPEATKISVLDSSAPSDEALWLSYNAEGKIFVIAVKRSVWVAFCSDGWGVLADSNIELAQGMAFQLFNRGEGNESN